MRPGRMKSLTEGEASEGRSGNHLTRDTRPPSPLYPHKVAEQYMFRFF